jgi:hypothetical protein
MTSAEADPQILEARERERDVPPEEGTACAFSIFEEPVFRTSWTLSSRIRMHGVFRFRL